MTNPRVMPCERVSECFTSYPLVLACLLIDRGVDGAIVGNQSDADRAFAEVQKLLVEDQRSDLVVVW